MKTTISTVFIYLLSFTGLSSETKKNDFVSNSQEDVLIGVFDGYDEEDGYAFIIADEEGYESMMYFQSITPEASKSTNLKSDKLIGKRFRITYETSEETTEDDDGMEDTYEMYTITKIEKL